MAVEPQLSITMLGGCAIACADAVVDDKTYRSKKLWKLLEYMITFRGREISQEELIALINPGEKSANPAGALKTLVYRIRAMLDDLKQVSGRDVIIAARSTYALNPALSVKVDVDEFETLCSQVGSPWLTDAARLDTCLKAVALYKGDFLPKSAGEQWVASLNIYYHSMYIRLVHTTVDLLCRAERWDDVVTLCEQAIRIDAFEEFFYFHLIDGLVRLGRHQAALEQYKKMYNVFYTEIGVTPSPELTALYKEIIRTTKQVEIDLTVIKQSLLQSGAPQGAFLCEFEVFKDIYNLEVRAASRTGRAMFLCLLTACSRDGSMPTVKTLNAYMGKLTDTVLHALRRGDIVANYSVSQLILLLPTQTYENADMVMRRIISQFHTQHARSPLRLEYSIQPFDLIP